MSRGPERYYWVSPQIILQTRFRRRQYIISRLDCDPLIEIERLHRPLGIWGKGEQIDEIERNST